MPTPMPAASAMGRLCMRAIDRSDESAERGARPESRRGDEPSVGLSSTAVRAATAPAMAQASVDMRDGEHAGHARRLGVGGGGPHGQAVPAVAQEHDDRRRRRAG